MKKDRQFTDYYKINIRIEEKIYLVVLFAWVIIFNLSEDSSVAYSLGFDKLFESVWIYFQVLLGIKMISDWLIRGRIKWTALGAVILGYISFFHNESFFLMPIVLFISAGDNVSYKGLTKTLFWSEFISWIIIVFYSLCFSGQLGTAIKDATGGIVYSLGFSHPNVLMLKFVQILFLYFVYKGNKIKAYVFPFACILLLCMYKITQSRTTFMAAIIVILIFWGMKINHINLMVKKILKDFRNVILLILIGISMVFMYNTDITDILPANSTLASRINQIFNYYKFYGFSLFGQKLAYKTDGLYTLDNAYIYLLLGFGIIIFIIFLLAEYAMLKYWIINENLTMLIISLAYILIGFFETGFIRASFNFTLFYFMFLIFSESKKNAVAGKNEDDKGKYL